MESGALLDDIEIAGMSPNQMVPARYPVLGQRIL